MRADLTVGNAAADEHAFGLGPLEPAWASDSNAMKQ